MELPNLMGNGGMLDGLKSRFGIGGNKEADAEYDEYYDEGYDEYDDDGFGDGYADDYADGYADGYTDYDAADAYEPYAPVTTRPAGDRRSTISAPRLVTIEDVRANTQIPDYLNRDPLPERKVTTARDTAVSTGYSANRVTVDAAASTPYSAALDNADRGVRSAGLNSLFESTEPEPVAADTPSFASQFTPSRGVQVMKPVSYNEAERIAKILRAGDVAVICLKNASAETGKRILDFSFGVACALDARVDCIADRVFVLNCGADLTDSERFTLRTQGVL